MMAGTSWQRSGMFAAALLLAAPDAFACSILPQNLSRAQVESYAREQYAKATAVVDAEVEEPMEFGPAYKSGLMPVATLRVIRRYKGTPQFPGAERILMVYLTSCDIELSRKGERIRILLTSGPELYRAEITANGPSTQREDGLAEFNAEIDRLAGTPRPAGISTYPGAIDPPSDAPTISPANGPAAPEKPKHPAPRASANLGIYLVGAFGFLLAFLAGVLVGRRSRPSKAASNI